MTFSILLHAQSSPIFRLLTSSLQSSLHSTKQGHISLPRPAAFHNPSFFYDSANGRELASFVLPSFLLSGRQKREDRGERGPLARPPAARLPARTSSPPQTRSLARSFVPLSARSFPSIHRRDCPPSSNAHLFCAECDYFWTRTNLSQELSITHNPIRNYKAIEPYIRGQCPV